MAERGRLQGAAQPGDAVVSIPRAVTIAIVVLSLGALVVSAILYAQVGFAAGELLIFTPALVAFVVVGGLVLLRQPSNVVGMLMLAFGTGGCVIYPMAALAAAPAGSVVAPYAGLVVQALDPITYLLITLLLLLFPDGHLPSPRWRPVVPLAVAGFVLSVIGNVVVPGSLQVFPQHRNPLGVDSQFLLVAGAVGYVITAVMLLAASASLVARWRASDSLVRAQLKWIALSGLLLGITTALYVVSFFVLGPMAVLPIIAAAIAFSLLPVTVAIAVLRYRLYEIDRIVSRTIGWALVTGILVAVFAGLLIGLQALLAPVTDNNTLAVAGSTLLAAALFAPVRNRVQHAVDRRFDRSRYDGERLLNAFADRLRDEVDLAAIAGDVRRVAAETTRPVSAGVWLRTVPSVAHTEIS